MALLDGIEGAAGGQVKQVEIVGPEIPPARNRDGYWNWGSATERDTERLRGSEPDFLYNKGAGSRC